MSTLELSPRTLDRLTDLARAWAISDEAAVVRLIDFWKTSQDSRDDADRVRVHAVYLGERAEGVYHPSTGRMDIVSGPAPAAAGLKPSPAAGQVIRAYQSARGQTVRGSRNGWDFWVITATGEPLRSIR
jgi:hypothetical protein